MKPDVTLYKIHSWKLENMLGKRICIRIIGTVVKLGVKGFNNLNYINISENNNIKNILRNNEIFLKNIPEKYKEIKFNRRNTIHPNSTSYNFVDVILLTVDSLPQNIKYQYVGYAFLLYLQHINLSELFFRNF
ncbi:hypothetical protein [Plasmodium yoelii yoelii]|uniref:Uncharacterized protein n=1 Tax=Plasmodium yoelii yoelii TaxID=73239 RepID=Q7RB55_PLAYO|nr:hypothetical protein [Plasmodium yoelii yoelii]